LREYWFRISNIQKGFFMKFSISNRKLLICTVIFLFLVFSGFIPAGAEESAPQSPKPAEAPKPFTASLDVLNQYVFRGLAVSKGDSAVFQPSVSLTLYGFTANIWSNMDTAQRTHNPNIPLTHQGDFRCNENDFTFSYTRELFPNFSATAGTVYYRLDYAQWDAFEVFGGASYTLPWFTTAFTMYREVAHYPGWWFQLDITKSIPLGYIEGMSLDLGASFGYLILEDKVKTVLDLAGTTGDYSEPHAGTVNAALKIPINQWVTLGPKIGLAFPLTDAASKYLIGNSWDKEDVHVFGGFNVTANF